MTELGKLQASRREQVGLRHAPPSLNATNVFLERDLFTAGLGWQGSSAGDVAILGQPRTFRHLPQHYPKTRHSRKQEHVPRVGIAWTGLVSQKT